MSMRTLRRLVVIVFALAGALGAGRVSAQNPPEAVEYYATDALGSVRVVFTPSGQVIGRSAYLPFGETREQTGSLPRQRFTSQERDGEAGLDYFNARSLQMRTGRMNQPDPVFANALTNPQRWNRYAYVGNNPLRMTDPTGMSPADKDGQFFDQDVPLSEQLARGGFNVGHLDASGSDMYAGFDEITDETRMVWSMREAAETARVGSVAPGVLSFQAAIRVGENPTNEAVVAAYQMFLSLLPAGLGDVLPSPDQLARELLALNRELILPVAGTVIQSGGRTLTKPASTALNRAFGTSLEPREWGRALEAMKASIGARNDFHEIKILSDGSVIDGQKRVLGNLADFVKGGLHRR
jgi:RHS repeat-associated protein